MKTVLILGSNQGNKKAVLSNAIKMIKLRIGKVIQKSSLYSTEPWGFLSEDNFLNQVVAVETQLNPSDVLAQALQIELELGRVRVQTDQRYASRAIDIDVLFYDNLIIDTPNLQVPHPRLTERRFVLEPLNEIMPQFKHPILQISIAECLEICPDKCKVSLL
ncbi:MAG: 2-amino-4-hydroxy-6-hydroxymethyldihydropteridine diphosphokinase [Marinifilaceae bacterium]